MEKWKDIKGYEGLYRISNKGRVLSLQRKNPIILKQNTNCNGYPYVVLTKCKKQKTLTIHRLVAKSFIPNPENKPCINHKDSNRSNYSLDNLEWVTYSENTKHAYKNGSMLKGGNRKLNAYDIPEIRDLYKDGLTTIEIADEYGVTHQAISDVINHKTWAYV